MYLQFGFLLLIGCFVSQLRASSDPIFYESFNETFEGSWIVSEKEDQKGVKHAKTYAIVTELDEPVKLKNESIVLQFEARFQTKGLKCGSAYLKYLRPQEAAAWSVKGFDNNSPYSIMFGPDECGNTEGVHFIVKHRNPKSGEYIEHHLKDPPPDVPCDRLTHVYTAILKPDNNLRILIDGEEKRKANFLDANDFEPPLIPAEMIPDPNDKKPEDWDERDKIPDPDAVKPDDWDEDAPFEIEDEGAIKPEGWLDDEPAFIVDVEAKRPNDWDDEVDGEWKLPTVYNPKCVNSTGCGEWRPVKINPAYKGKWYAPLIDNPNYNGTWKPREIQNPDHFQLDRPNLEPIAAIRIEKTQSEISFGNILVANDEKIAESYRNSAWKPKFNAEKDERMARRLMGLNSYQKVVFRLIYKLVDIHIPYWNKLDEFQMLYLIEEGKDRPNLTIGIIVTCLALTITVAGVLHHYTCNVINYYFDPDHGRAWSTGRTNVEAGETPDNLGSYQRL